MGRNNDTILRFVNRKDAEDSLENSKKLQGFDRAAVGIANDVNIFVKQNLSPYMNKLAYFCRVLKRRSLIEKVTTFKGVIKITRMTGPDGNHRVTNIISHKEDLLKLYPNLDEYITTEAV